MHLLRIAARLSALRPKIRHAGPTLIFLARDPSAVDDVDMTSQEMLGRAITF
jgi:hypothetical protein